MFDSDLDGKTTRDGVTDPRRRAFLASATATVAGLALWPWKTPSALQVAAANNDAKEVTVVLFSEAGQRLKQARVAKVIKTEAEWRKRLPLGVFDITRNADTEIAYLHRTVTLTDFASASPLVFTM